MSSVNNDFYGYYPMSSSSSSSTPVSTTGRRGIKRKLNATDEVSRNNNVNVRHKREESSRKGVMQNQKVMDIISSLLIDTGDFILPEEKENRSSQQH